MQHCSLYNVLQNENTDKRTRLVTFSKQMEQSFRSKLSFISRHYNSFAAPHHQKSILFNSENNVFHFSIIVASTAVPVGIVPVIILNASQRNMVLLVNSELKHLCLNLRRSAEKFLPHIYCNFASFHLKQFADCVSFLILASKCL